MQAAQGLAAFIAGFGSGYLRQGQLNRMNARQDALDAEQKAMFAHQQQLWADQAAEKQAATNAASPITADSGQQVTDASGNQDFAANPSDAAWLAQQAKDQASLMPASTAAPAAGQATPAYGVAGGGQAPTITTSAPDLTKLNSPSAIEQRVGTAILPYNPGQGAAMLGDAQRQDFQQWQENFTKQSAANQQAYKEMVGTIAGGTPQQISDTLTKGYNDGNTYNVTQDPKGAWNVKITDAKGNVVHEQTYANRMAMAGPAIAHFDPNKWVSMRQTQANADRAQANSDRAYQLDQARLNLSTKASNLAEQRANQVEAGQKARQSAIYQAMIGAGYTQQQAIAASLGADMNKLGMTKGGKAAGDPMHATFTPDPGGGGGRFTQSDKQGNTRVTNVDDTGKVTGITSISSTGVVSHPAFNAAPTSAAPTPGDVIAPPAGTRGVRSLMRPKNMASKSSVVHADERAMRGQVQRPPRIGDVVKGYRYLGGSVNDPKSWTAMSAEQ